MSYRYLETKIGEELNIPMWSALRYDEKNFILNNPDKVHNKYYQVNFTEYKGIILLNIIFYNPHSNLLISGKKAKYTLNLNTNKPTSKSKIKRKLSDETIELIHKYLDLRKSILEEDEELLIAP